MAKWRLTSGRQVQPVLSCSQRLSLVQLQSHYCLVHRSTKVCAQCALPLHSATAGQSAAVSTPTGRACPTTEWPIGEVEGWPHQGYRLPTVVSLGLPRQPVVVLSKVVVMMVARATFISALHGHHHSQFGLIRIKSSGPFWGPSFSFW